MSQTNQRGETFGAWLLAQRDRSGLVGQLVDGGKADRREADGTFPKKVRLGPLMVAWYLTDIEAFIESPFDYRAGGSSE